MSSVFIISGKYILGVAIPARNLLYWARVYLNRILLQFGAAVLVAAALFFTALSQ